MAKSKTKFNISKLSKYARVAAKLAPLVTPIGVTARIVGEIINSEPAGLGSTVHGEKANSLFNVDGISGASVDSKKLSGFKMKYKKSSFPFKSNEPKPRDGSVYVGPKPNQKNYVKGDEYKMSDKPFFKGQGRSTHLIGDDNKTTAWPTLFQTKKGVFYEGGLDEAKRKGEVYKFDSKKEMTDFARKGNWKK